MRTRNLLGAISVLLLLAPAAGADNILLTNDDGYGSYGIEAVKSALEAAGHTVYVSAPAENQSGKSGSVNIDYRDPVGFTAEHTNAWSVDGTPVDSVNAGLFGLVPDDVDIDLVVSGVNDGENVAKFTNASGTVGAAMFAVRRNIPSIAVSVGQDIAGLSALGDCPPPPEGYSCLLPILAQVEANAEAGADTAAALVVDIIDELGGAAGIPDGLALNVNVPSGAFTPKGVRVTRSDNAQAFDLVIVPDGSGGLVVDIDRDDILAGAITGAVDCSYLPDGTVNLNSEGQAFACGYTTIAVVNGNIDASSLRTAFRARRLACSLKDIATVGIFRCRRWW